MSDIFEELDKAMDEESWEWLMDNHPSLATKVEKLVKLGATPAQIRTRVMGRLGQHRMPLATRCESGARYLEASKK